MTIADSANISKSNLFSQTHANVYNLINDKDNVPLPTGLPSDHKYVRVREPRNFGRDFDGFPFIVVEPIDLEQGGGTVSSTKVMTTYDIVIRIVTKDSSADSTGSYKGAEMLNTISDSVIETLNENDDTLRNFGMKNFEMESSYDLDDIGGKTIFNREFTLTFNQLQSVK